MKALKFFLSADFREFLGYALVSIFFFYLIVFACVAPSVGLVTAVAFEIGVYLLFLVYRIKRRKAKSAHARQIIFSTMVHYIAGGRQLAAAISAGVALLGSLILLCAGIDAFSFALAACGKYRAATYLYGHFPVSCLAGVSPGYTMELLSGAQLKAGRYAEVEQMYRGLMEIRMKYFGARSERICDLYADFGDLAERRREYKKAVACYVNAIKLSKEIKVPQGCGKFLTRLGQIEAQQGDSQRGLEYLEEALTMRSRIFGPHSEKVAETLLVTASVRSAMGDKETARRLYLQASAIHHANSKPHMNPAFYSALMSLFLMAAAYISTSKKGWLTRLSLHKLERILAEEPISAASKERIERHLNVLREYAQGKDQSTKESNKNHELTQHCGLTFLLSSQDLR